MTTAHKDLFPTSERDWPEDFKQENGCYENKCRDCTLSFMGNKHRRQCKKCAALARPEPASTPVAVEFPWNEFPGWLIEHMEGEILDEERLQLELHKMINALVAEGRYVRPAESDDEEDAQAAPSETQPVAVESIRPTTILNNVIDYSNAKSLSEQKIAFDAIMADIDAHVAAQVAKAPPLVLYSTPKVKDHVLAAVVNKLRDTAIQFHASGQLRDRIRGAIAPLIAGIETAPQGQQSAAEYVKGFEDASSAAIDMFAAKADPAQEADDEQAYAAWLASPVAPSQTAIGYGKLAFMAGRASKAAPAQPAVDLVAATDERKHGTLYAAINRACRELPDCYQVVITLEKNSGWVELDDGCGGSTAIEGEGYLCADVNEAIDKAIAAATLARAQLEGKS